MTGPTTESASAAPNAGSSWRDKHAAKYGDLRARQAERKAKSVPLASGDTVEVTSNGKTLKGTVSERYRPGVDRQVSVRLEGGSSVQSFGAASVSKLSSDPKEPSERVRQAGGKIVTVDGKEYIVHPLGPTGGVSYWTARDGDYFGATRTAGQNSKPGSVGAKLRAVAPEHGSEGVSEEVQKKYKLPHDLKDLTTSKLMLEWETRQAVHDHSGSSSYGAKKKLSNKTDDDFIDIQMDRIDEELRKRWDKGEDLEFWFPYG